MTIQQGSRLGPYEILSQLGAGGMGEVYRARDTRVGRDVAVKVLPPVFASNDERRQRFEQEARAAAALNHPNLLTIHDVGAHDGVAFIVSELLEGETLREKAGGPGDGPRIPTRKAIEWATAIANGLAAAHDKGVVHRDLKPDNVFVTNDGRVKILDFGLAKLTSAFHEETADSKTAQRNTSPGAVMGTVGYMSPEQVRGQNVDQRTDIFSLGAILYEMLSGRRAFHGASSADTMSAILREDPPEISGSGLEISSGLDRVLRRCLEKNPEERFHSAHDVAYALEAITGTSSRSAAAIAIEEPRRRVLPLALVAGATVIAAAAFLAGRLSTPPAQTGPASRVSSPAHLVRLTNLSGVESEVSISPDGTSFLYSALVGDTHDIFVQRVGGRTAVNLTKSSEDEGFGTFSPDGNQIAFTRDDGIWVMGATGESMRRLTDSGFHPAWSADGKSIVYSTVLAEEPTARSGVGELRRVDVLTGASATIDFGGSYDAVQPSCSPDGKWITFWGLFEETARRMISVVPATGGRPEALIDDGSMSWRPVFTPDGRAIVYASDRGGSMNLWQQPFDPATGKATGEPVPVTLSTEWNGPLSIARSGAIAFMSRSSTWSVERWPLDVRARRLGEPRTMIGRAGSLALLDPSPDGASLVLGLADPHEDIVVFRLDDPEKQLRLTNDVYRDRGPRWLADGSRVLFYSDRSGEYELWSVRPDGSDLRLETRGQFILVVPSPDGASLLGQAGQASHAAILDLRTPTDQREPALLPDIREGVSFLAQVWTPDSRHIVGFGRSSAAIDGGEGVYLYDVETKTYEQLLTGESGRLIAVTPDGTTLVRVRTNRVELVDLRTKAIHQAGTLPLGTFGLTITLSRDATALFATVVNHEADIWMLNPVK